MKAADLEAEADPWRAGSSSQNRQHQPSQSKPMPHHMIQRERTRVRTGLRKVLLPLIVCLATSMRLDVCAADAPMVLAVHPYLPVSEIESRFGPFAAYLSKELGRQVTVRVGGNYAEHGNAIGKDQVDIAFLGPAPYIQVVRQFGAKPLLARFEVDGQANLYGVVAVRKESPAATLAGLKHARIAFGDPESTMSHIVPRYLLIQAGVPDGAARYAFLGSHKNVAIGLLAGDYDAGAMKKEVFDEFAPKGLRALATTPGVPDHLFVTRATMPPADVKRLREAMLRLKDQAQGPSILNKMHKGLTALIPAADADYEALRRMVRAVDAANR